MIVKSRRDLNKIRILGEKELQPGNIRIQVGAPSSALSAQGGGIAGVLRDELERQGVDAAVVEVGCLGLCTQEPIVDVIAPGKPKVTYGRVTADAVPQLVKAVAGGKVLKKLALYRTDSEELVTSGKLFSFVPRTPRDYRTLPPMQEYAFFQPQLRIAMRNAGCIQPGRIEEYIARDGYAALHKAVTRMSPEKVVDAVIRSGLRGRGGGGFPAGLKWRACRSAPGREKYVICNCSEGDPGIGMHKSLIESDPHSIIEGLAIGGYAIGASEGYIYLRHGYAEGRRKLQQAIDQATSHGLLGGDIFGSGFSFTVTIKEGAGAYVCGESTALMACLEGRAGEPRPKYVHTAEKGLWDKPTNLNNVETWCNIPPIIFRGAGWYSKTGTAGSTGTKVVSLTGNVKRPCLAEVPMGTPVRDIIRKLGGGVPRGRKLKAVGIGGPPGGVLPASLAAVPLDFDELGRVGSMLGSGGMIVMDDTNCMVDITRFFLKFLEEESCGRCLPCREGIKRMHEIVEGISIGIGRHEDLELLEELACCVSQAALCDLGKSAPNTTRSALRYFRQEFLVHIEQEVCAAKRCFM